MNQPVRFSALGIIGLFILSANISLAEEATEFRGTTDSKKEEGASESDGNEAATPTNKKETEDADADEKKSVDDSQTPAATTDGDDSTKSPKETVDTPVDNGDSAGETPRASSKEDASSKDEQASDGVAQQKHDASPPPPANDQGILEINTAPHNAKVFIGYSAHRTDQEIGETPFALQLPPGTYYLSLRKEGYIPATAVAKVEAGKTASVQIQLEQEVGHRHRKVRIAGHVCLWTGVVAAVTGVVLVAVKESENDELNTGTVGFGLVGGGIAVGLAGALMLGLTHRPKSLYSMPNQTVSAAPLPGGGGALFTYSKRF